MKPAIKKSKFIYGTLLAGLIVYWLTTKVDIHMLFTKHSFVFHYKHIIVALSLLFGAQVIRAFRFSYCLGGAVSVPQLVKITTHYNLYTALLPGGIGEMSFPFLLSQTKIDNPVSSGVVTVGITRIHDAFFLLAVFIISSHYIIVEFAKKIQYTYVSISLLLMLLVGYIFFKRIIKILESIVIWLLKKHNSKVLEKSNLFLQNTSNIIPSNAQSVVIFLFTLVSWTIAFGGVQYAYQSIGIPLTYMQALLMGVIVNMTSLIPINTIGGFGYKEAGIAIGFAMLGYPSDQAVMYGFLYHLVSLGLSFVMAALGSIVVLMYTHRGREHG